MNLFFKLPLLVLAALGVSLAWGGVASAEPRLALVVANASYGGSLDPLANPINDGKLIAATLEKLGFKVTLVTDIDQNGMKRAISKFGDELLNAGSATSALFYFAGHGLQVDGENYLVPLNASISKEADVDIEAVSANTILKQMEYAGAHTSIVILDACRNNPLSRGFRSATRGLARMDAPNGSYVAYSTAPGEVAADGTGANSPFALALVSEITKPGQGIEEAFRNVRIQVAKTTSGAQTPWDSSSLMNPFYFAGEKEVAAAEVTAPAANANEALFWQSIMDSKRAADFVAYLKKYPSGDFADLARARLDELETPEPQQQAAIVRAAPEVDTAALDRAFWNSVRNSTKPTDFEAYLKKFPNGAFVDLAKNKLKKLKGASGTVTVETAPATSETITETTQPPKTTKQPVTGPKEHTW